MPTKTTALLAMLCAGTMLSTADRANAQASSASNGATTLAEGNDIVVTARKRDESLMRVPVAVSAITAVQIERAGVSSLASISKMAPQVLVARADSGTGAVFTIRGVGSPAIDPALEQSVSVNIDGVQSSRGNIVTQGFFDLAQAEVLKGPQALFFGKNSPAGVISLKSKGPGRTLEGFARAGYEFEAHERFAEAAIGGPITSTLGARVALRASKMRGWLTNTALPRSDNPFFPGFTTPGRPAKGNGGEELLGRVTLVFSPDDGFDATLKLSGGHTKDNGTTSQSYCGGDASFPTTSGVPDTMDNCKLDSRYALSGIPREIAATSSNMRDGMPYSDNKAGLVSLTMNYRTGDLRLTSVTGYSKLNYKQAVDFTYSSFGALFGGLAEKFRSFSQEIRLATAYDGPLNFVVGGYYEDTSRSNGNDISFAFVGPDPVTGKYQTVDQRGRATGTTLSAFGQLTWEPVDQVELSGGARYTREKKKVSQSNAYVHALLFDAFGFRPVGDVLYSDFSDANWSPEATISWKPDGNMLIFGAFKTGYKSGGISAPGLLQATMTSDSLRFESERSKGFEAGAKLQLFDRSVRLEATAYSYLYSNLQVASFNEALNSFFLTNAASARVKGVELSASWRPLAGLDLNAGAAYNHARYKSFPSGQCYFDQPAPGCVNGFQDLTGKPMSRAPDWNLSFGGSYEMPVNDKMAIGVNADMSYSSSYVTNEDHHPLSLQGAYTLINAGLRLHQRDGGWEAALIGRNLTNRYYRIVGNSKSYGGFQDFWGSAPRGRELRLQLGYAF